MRGVATLSCFVMVCIGVGGCAVASEPGKLSRAGSLDTPRWPMRVVDGGKLEEERLDCPVRCARDGSLVRCRAECPPLETLR